MSIRVKLFFWIGFLGVAVIIVTIAFMGNQAVVLIGDSEIQELEQIENTVQARLNELTDAARDLTLSVAQNPEVQHLFAARDRNKLIETMLPVYEAVKHRYAQTQFHLPDSTSFLRLHQPDQYGDSLKDFRFTVNAANRSLETAAGVEEGRAGFGLRVVTPVFFEARHIGSVEFGGDFGPAFIDSIKSDFAGEYFLYQLQESSVAWAEHGAKDQGLLAGTAAQDDWPGDGFILEGVKQGKTMQYVTEDGFHRVLLMPLRDFQNEIVGYLKVVKDRGDILALMRSSKKNGYLLGVTAALLTAGLLYIIQGYLLKPLVGLADAAAAMGDGDFTQSFSYPADDEIGQITTALSHLQDRITNTVGQIVLVSNALNQASHGMSASTEETAASIEEIAGTTNHFAANTERLDEHVQAMTMEAKTTLEHAASGSEALSHIVTSSEGLSEQISDIEAQIANLVESSEAIGRIVDVMAKIAEQTNLLALNAAIEAARAGEHGRGFAVVANEVRNLAEESAGAAQGIIDLVGTIQQTTSKTAKDMGSGARAADHNANLARENSQIITQIVTSMDALAQRVEEMSTALEAIRLDSQQIAAATEEQSAGTEEIASSAQELDKMAANLRDLVDWFEVE
ncbi:MAG: HAMP domain-containing protein [Firmicutes bacterium]|nr:HAMP domain-containing protein [Bacillota bacterium]